MTQDLTRMGNETIDALVEDMIQQKDTLERALPQPFGATEAPMQLRLQKFAQAIQTGPSAFIALRKVFGRHQVVKEFLELYPELLKAVRGSVSAQGSVSGAQESVDTTGDQGDEGSAR